MKLLAIDTATEACSVAVSIDGEVVERYRIAPREQGALILPMIDRLLAETGLRPQQLDGIAFGQGPGSFTGVRIAAGVVQGIAYAARLPVVPVSTLAAIAQGVYREHGASHVLAAIDARMGDVYWGIYQLAEDKRVRLVGEERVCRPEHVTFPASGFWFGAGTGWDTHGEVLSSRLGNRLWAKEPSYLPHAQDILGLAEAAFRRGQVLPAERAVPVYLRDKVTRQVKP